MSGQPIIDCDSCGRRREHHAHRWCKACWCRWDRAEQPDTGPPPRTTGRWEEFRELTREQHYTLENAAARMGISERTAWRHEARLRAAGVPATTHERGLRSFFAVSRTAAI